LKNQNEWELVGEHNPPANVPIKVINRYNKEFYAMRVKTYCGPDGYMELVKAKDGFKTTKGYLVGVVSFRHLVRG
jgi:hypothetical protein